MLLIATRAIKKYPKATSSGFPKVAVRFDIFRDGVFKFPAIFDNTEFDANFKMAKKLLKVTQKIIFKKVIEMWSFFTFIKVY